MSDPIMVVYELPWPTTSAGEIVERPQVDTYVAELFKTYQPPQENLEGWASVEYSGLREWLFDMWDDRELSTSRPRFAGMGEDDLPYELTDEQVEQAIRAMLPAYLRKLWADVDDREFVFRFDGFRWWADAPTDANYPTSTALAFHALSELGLFLAPTDGGEFLDVAGIAATNVLIAELRSRVATRLARLRLQDPAAEAACQQVLDAVSDLENDLVDLARAAREAFNDNGRNRH